MTDRSGDNQARRHPMRRVRSCDAAAAWLLLPLLLLAAACHRAGEPLPPASPPALALAPPDARVRFAVIGDYGLAGKPEEEVATLVKSWRPDFVITTGDNNYPRGAAETMDANIGQYYSAFIAPYKGSFGPGATRNRFFPSLGNHDLHADAAATYLAYFTLPGNGRYYDFTAGPVHFFALDSDVHEPDGTSSRSKQGQWLQAGLGASRSCWRIVYLHHPPYASSGKEKTRMRWPFKAWGADVVLAGHEHAYERLAVDGVTYFVVGLGGGGDIDRFKQTAQGSLKRYNKDYGAMLVAAEDGTLVFRFVTRTGTVVDEYRQERTCSPPSGSLGRALGNDRLTAADARR
jgi:tartrate-resistant acid phosphatase type 5